MSRDWMLLETLGDEPTVIAIGSQARNLAPLESVLRRNRHRPLIEAAIADCRRTGEVTAAFTPARDRVVHVHPISMDKANIHGVQSGSARPTSTRRHAPWPGPVWATWIPP
ncbi:Uncharacterised protein [Mycobacteroides abscessus]|nr:Uncharacterised protein [Mycobacteroides abscessus]